jgi:predicted nuclease of predicted toxin-antitoxin system
VIRLLVDQNFNGKIIDGLIRRDANLDIVRLFDVGLSAASDPTILEWAANQDRILLTHDRRTIPRYAYARVTAGQPMPGVLLVSDDMPIGQAIDEILVGVHCLSPDECRDVVKFFPL